MNSYQEKNNPMEKSEFQDNLTILRNISFFSEFPLEMLKVVAYLCTREVYKEGDIIFSQDNDDGRAYCILSGEAGLSRIHRDNDVIVRSCGADSFFGAFTLTSTVNRLFSLAAISDTCCLVLTRENFQEIIDQFPDSRQNIIKGLAENIVSWEEKFLKENLDCESCRSTMGVSLI
jgi:CRP/FNR family cyclic AMP-dependent transcriptional regulator